MHFATNYHMSDWYLPLILSNSLSLHLVTEFKFSNGWYVIMWSAMLWMLWIATQLRYECLTRSVYKNSASLKCFHIDILSFNLAFRLSVDLWESVSQLYTRNTLDYYYYNYYYYFEINVMVYFQPGEWMRMMYYSRKWHRHTRKRMRVLLSGVEPKTFRLLVRMLYHWVTGDSWELRPLN